MNMPYRLRLDERAVLANAAFFADTPTQVEGSISRRRRGAALKECRSRDRLNVALAEASVAPMKGDARQRCSASGTAKQLQGQERRAERQRTPRLSDGNGVTRESYVALMKGHAREHRDERRSRCPGAGRAAAMKGGGGQHRDSFAPWHSSTSMTWPR